MMWPLILLAAMTPDAALDKLQTGNTRYVEDRPLYPDQGGERREKLVPKQEPFAIIIGCSDSRVPPELIFDQGLGDLFVVRVAGNVVGPVELDSIEFAADQLHAPLIVVLGHQNCGAVKAVLDGKPNTNDIENLVPFIEPAVKQAASLPGDRLTNTIQTHARLVVKSLKSNPILARLMKQNKLKIVGAYYELEEGKVTLLNPKN